MWNRLFGLKALFDDEDCSDRASHQRALYIFLVLQNETLLEANMLQTHRFRRVNGVIDPLVTNTISQKINRNRT